MELLFELFLTVSLSLIFTSLFIKLFSMNPVVITDKDDHQFFTEETLQMDKFQWVPFNDEVIKLQECKDEGKSMVEFHRVVGVEMEEKIRDVEVVDHSNKANEISLEEEDDDDDDDDHHHHDVNFESDINDQEDGKTCEIEIESVEEVECEDKKDEEMMNDWEKIGRKDFEELLGNKAGLYDFDVSFGELYDFDVPHGK